MQSSKTGVPATCRSCGPACCAFSAHSKPRCAKSAQETGPANYLLLYRRSRGTGGALSLVRPMHTLSRFLSPLSRRVRAAGIIASTLLLGLSAPALVAQNTGDDAAKRRRGAPSDEGGRRGSPEDMQARALGSLRERLEVPDDEEWKIISERLTKVMELRRSTMGGALGGIAAFAGRGPQTGGDNARGRGSRSGGSSELAALQSAIRDKLPDAEIKSRLERLRENRKQNEARLSKAQEDLRAVLSVRQEAVAVMFGLLP